MGWDDAPVPRIEVAEPPCYEAPMLILAAALSSLIGLVLGMLGGGGAILTLPMLVYVVGLEPKAAIASSLFVVGATSLVGTSVHARAGAVRWKIGSIFGAAAMVGAYVGGRLAHFVPSTVLLVMFGTMMLVTATAMLRGRKASEEVRPMRLASALGLGGAVGIISGLVGAGGGFLIVPALTIFGGIAMREAIGTSLFVIALQSFAGFAGHVTHVHLDWTLLLTIAGAAMASSVVGARVGTKMSPTLLRQGFAWLVIAMGLFIFGKQLPPLVALLAGAVSLLFVVWALRASKQSG